MKDQEIVLRKSRRHLIISAIVSGLIATGTILSAFVFWENKDGQWWVILGGLVPLAGCIYLTIELFGHKIELVISNEGIRLRGKGFYTWSAIEKFSTDVDDGITTLILYVKGKAPIHFAITGLEMKKKELIELILAHGQPAGMYYTKHH